MKRVILFLTFLILSNTLHAQSTTAAPTGAVSTGAASTAGLPTIAVPTGGLPTIGLPTIGLPEVVNYSKHAYRAGTQNWAIRQGRNGVMYFANNEGLLSFDGVYWKVYPLPNKTKVRSLEMGDDNRIYIGGENEFGYFSPDQSGVLRYFSLRELVQEKDRGFADIWNVTAWKGSVFFRASNKIFLYKDKSIITFNPVSHWRFMGMANGQVIVQDATNGLLRFNNDRWEPFLANSALPSEFLSNALLPMGRDTTILVTMDAGLYRLSGNSAVKMESAFINQIRKERIYGAMRVNDQLLALSTSLGGCYIVTNKGEFVHRFSRGDGLQNNNVLSVFRDRDHNLWLGLDNGIDFIAYDNAIKTIYPVATKDEAGYASIIFKGRLYVGTSNGLYSVPVGEFSDLSFVKGAFSFVENSRGQVWGLSEINGKLLMSHHEGMFEIRQDKAFAIERRNGFWGAVPLSRIDPVSRVAVGNYNGINFLAYDGKEFRPAGEVSGFDIASRFLCTDTHDENVIWTSHPYRGVFKISLQPDGKSAARLYTSKDGLPLSLNNNYVYKVKNRILVATESGIYEYNPGKDRFAASSYYNEIFKGVDVRYLKEDQAGNVWFVTGKELGVLDVSGNKPKIIFLPELNQKLVSGFEYIQPLNEKNILVGSEKGIYHINYQQYKQNKNRIDVQIRMLRSVAKSDTVLFGGYLGEVNQLNKQTESQVPQIAHELNSIGFEFSSTLFSQQSSIAYSYFLDGFDAGWSHWSVKSAKEYTSLPAGQYTFYVKARNNFGSESPVTGYTFVIQPPWYQTSWAYLAYGVLLLGLAFLFYEWQEKRFLRQRQKHEEEQQRLQYLHQLELEKNEKEIIKLKNEKLEAEILHKNTDLATSAMHLVQKAELLSKLKTDLVKITKTADDEKINDDLKRVIKVVAEENKVDKDWGQFSKHFDSVHSNFLIALKERYPKLTASELKMSAYLRMNLSSKEIAELMNISLRGVEVSRYRLRKKLQLPTEVNMFNFLLGFHIDESRDSKGTQS
ncbi:two-component regulator propeller domain-containing protein [Dyadobacter sp. Leaf189]|uniref:two-component regulator propeller domain-containing protein n=1 Tax=Dyadobacter sp. Leaf189 TaxID=1736295 RepID=UPI00138ED812|nr:two-component regulator propeller domain-containing protein [Dyadobacter sp. Leaf189]